jgi:hypothetical protein
MTFERFDGISGAARIITARRRQQGTQRDLIRPHQQNEKRPHQLSSVGWSAPLATLVTTGSGSPARHR